MLVLTRKTGEEVIIGDGIRVAVVGIQGNKVRLGFVAPEDIPIRREELCFSFIEPTEHQAGAREERRGASATSSSLAPRLSTLAS